MKNLYATLGFGRIVEDPDQVAAALARLNPIRSEALAVRLVLGDPVRKAHYDWVLRSALRLARSRQRLGLGADPFLPRLEAWGTAPGISGVAPPSDRNPRIWILGVGLGALVLSLGVFWAASTPPAPMPRSAMPAAAPPVAEARSSIGGSPSAGVVPKPRDPELHNPELPVPGLEQVPPPTPGALQLETSVELRIPWQVNTVPGQDYFLILSEAQTQHRVLTLYLHGGEPFLGMIPEGEFSLAYTSGFHWYGPRHRFGPGARMLKAGRPFRLAQDPDDSVIWELNLQPASGPDPLFTPDDSARATDH